MFLLTHLASTVPNESAYTLANYCIAKYGAHPVTSLAELYRTHKVLHTSRLLLLFFSPPAQSL